MRLTEKKWTQWLPISLDEAWDFFSRPENLNDLTPPDVQFQILSDIKNQEMYQGMIIRYKIKPLLNIPFQWTTEITTVKAKQYFIDEQRFGPYSFWHHQHHFESSKGGTLMTDHLHYGIPLGPIGRIMGKLLIDKKIDDIFEYRKVMLENKYKKQEAVWN